MYLPCRHALPSQWRSQHNGLSRSLSISLVSNCICRPCCAHSSHALPTSCLPRTLSQLLSRCATLPLSRDWHLKTRVAFGAATAEQLSLSACGYSYSMLCPALPWPARYSPPPTKHSCTPTTCDPCRRHHNKAVSCCSNSVALARKLQAPRLFVCLRFLHYSAHTQTLLAHTHTDTAHTHTRMHSQNKHWFSLLTYEK